MIFHVEKTFKAHVCQICGKHSKNKCNIIKHYKKDHIILFIINHRSLDFKSLLEKANTTLIYSFLDNPSPLIRNVSARPFHSFSTQPTSCVPVLYLSMSLILPVLNLVYIGFQN